MFLVNHTWENLTDSATGLVLILQEVFAAFP